jgi:hypothetical protein
VEFGLLTIAFGERAFLVNPNARILPMLPLVLRRNSAGILSRHTKVLKPKVNL